MGIIYLAALVLGLGTLTLQFILSHVGGADADADADGDGLHLEAGADELDVGGDLDHELELGGHAELDEAAADVDHSSVLGDAVGVFLSMRFWTFALMAFGMVGSLLHYLDLSSFGVALALSVISGFVSGSAAGVTFRMLKGGVSSSTGHDETIGKMAKVTVPLRKGRIGKVRVQVRGNTVDLLATTDAETIAPGEQVVVVEHRGEHVYVEPIRKLRGP